MLIKNNLICFKWVSGGWCGTRGRYQHFTKAQMWLQLIREGEVRLVGFVYDVKIHPNMSSSFLIL